MKSYKEIVEAFNVSKAVKTLSEPSRSRASDISGYASEIADNIYELTVKIGWLKTAGEDEIKNKKDQENVSKLIAILNSYARVVIQDIKKLSSAVKNHKNVNEDDLAEIIGFRSKKARKSRAGELIADIAWIAQGELEELSDTAVQLHTSVADNYPSKKTAQHINSISTGMTTIIKYLDKMKNWNDGVKFGLLGKAKK